LGAAGQADYTIGLALGYGRARAGRVGQQSGYNAYRLRSSANPHFAAGARLTIAGRTQQIATTQNHGAMEGRPIVREANFDQFQEHPDFARSMGEEAREPEAGPLYLHPYVKNPKTIGMRQWGMAVDFERVRGLRRLRGRLSKREQHSDCWQGPGCPGREMHWIRLDRYYTQDRTTGTLASRRSPSSRCSVSTARMRRANMCAR